MTKLNWTRNFHYTHHNVFYGLPKQKQKNFGPPKKVRKSNERKKLLEQQMKEDPKGLNT